MSLVIRPAHADELASAEELVVRSINDLTVRHGFGPIAAARAPDFQHFCLRDDPRGVWLAEERGEIAGFALSWVCESLWFLAELFVAPGHQGKRIGNQLLERTLEHARQARARHQSLITFAFNVASQGLYVRHGLVPRVPIHLCSAARESLAAAQRQGLLRATRIRATPIDFDDLRQLDIAALGVSREKHHRYLLGTPGTSGVFLEDAGQRVGYAYISSAGHVGPLAVKDARAMTAAFATALSLAAAGEATQVSAFVPGSCDALGLAASLGMRFTLPMMLMSDSEVGDWTRYLPRNPGFM